MEFYIEGHSSVPVVTQIAEQIRFAVMMGILRNGDTLPSIRDVEKQTGIHHSQIHKAYLSLRRSGLLVLTRGKGSMISTAINSPDSISKNCSKLSQQVISKARRLGLSPTAFARYLSWAAPKSEGDAPFIAYVDDHEEIATQRAAEIEELWKVPIKGLTFRELKTEVAEGASIQKVVVNHVMYDHACTLLSKKKSSIIPVKVRLSEQIVKLLSEIKPNSSVVLVHLPQPAHRVHFMVAQIKELVKSPGVTISSTSVHKVSNFGKLLDGSRYDYCIVGPAVRGEVPHELRQNPRLLLIDPLLDQASLEAARISAGVVI